MDIVRSHNFYEFYVCQRINEQNWGWKKKWLKKKSQGLGYFLLFNKKYKVAKVDQ